jgi:uncharacterized protein (DUF169 family)
MPVAVVVVEEEEVEEEEEEEAEEHTSYSHFMQSADVYKVHFNSVLSYFCITLL